MSFFICIVPVCPVRNEGSHKSEQVSQLLFGEVAEVLETTKDFIKVKCRHDEYIGWCQAIQLAPIEDDAVNFEKVLAREFLNLIDCNGNAMHIPLASNIGFFTKGKRLVGKLSFEERSKGIVPNCENITEREIKRIANLYLNTPYQWGGRSVFGVDCSGFTQTVLSFFDIALPRDAYQQATQGEEVVLQEVKCGDLAFFDNAGGRIIHVGILLSDNCIIHAAGKVRIDTIDNSGIINSETGLRTHKLKVIKRMF